MSPEVVVDWLSKNDQYARVIVSLAGIRTGPATNAVPIRIECLWDSEFKPPAVFSIPTEEGTLFWSSDSVETGLFRKTLGLLAETFSQIQLPRRVVVFHGEVSLDSKKLHFKAFNFGDAHVVPSNNTIIFNHSIWNVDTLQNVVRKFVNLRRKLKGIGLDGE